MLRLSFSSKLNWGSYIVSIAKTASKKIVLIRAMKFLSPKVILYLYKSTIRPYMEYHFYVWACAPNCYSDELDNLQKRVCMTVSLSLAVSLKLLAHRWSQTCIQLSSSL